MYMSKEQAEAEVVLAKVDKVLAAIGDDYRTRFLFLTEIRKRPTPGAQLLYCRNFFIELEKHREWANKNYWFV